MPQLYSWWFYSSECESDEMMFVGGWEKHKTNTKYGTWQRGEVETASVYKVNDLDYTKTKTTSEMARQRDRSKVAAIGSNCFGGFTLYDDLLH